MSNITIRYATPADAELIADMSRTTFYETFAPFNAKENMDRFMNEQFTHESLMKEVGAEGNVFFLAYDGKEPVGYVRLREGEKNPAFNGLSSMEIARIYAVSSSIGKGVGSQLMIECLRAARERNKQLVWLGVWEKNERAIQFYTRWGFEKFGEHVFMLGNDAQTDFLMKKLLV